MRALLMKSLDLENGESFAVENQHYHHLKNVLRVKTGEEILILNGNGLGKVFKISQIQKNKIELGAVGELISRERNIEIDICLGKLKRDAMDLAIKQCCELGVRRLIISETEYSQNYSLKADRVQRLVTSAVEQSNNYFLPEVVEMNISEVPFKAYEQVFLFSFEGQNDLAKIQGKTLLVIGPEGGFSRNEETAMGEFSNLHSIKLNLPILRAVTAVPCALGYALRAYE